MNNDNKCGACDKELKESFRLTILINKQQVINDNICKKCITKIEKYIKKMGK